jgi:hypothetical protein
MNRMNRMNRMRQKEKKVHAFCCSAERDERGGAEPRRKRRGRVWTGLTEWTK